ncbi:hypothetical protein EKA14_26480 [Bacillus mycoides]|nr:hypothetical protein EKA14_26480 [Bacillus mycoides]
MYIFEIIISVMSSILEIPVIGMVVGIIVGSIALAPILVVGMLVLLLALKILIFTVRFLAERWGDSGCGCFFFALIFWIIPFTM